MPRKSSSLEILFDALIADCDDIPMPQRDYRFTPERKFEIDRVWVPQKFGVELQGDVWHKSGHTTGRGLIRDYTKHNLLTLHGWRVLQFSRDMLENNPDECLEQIKYFVGLPFTVNEANE